MKLATAIAAAIIEGRLEAVPSFTPWDWSTVCGVFDGVPYVWGKRDCSAMFHACGLLAGHVGPRLTTRPMAAYPRLFGPVPGAAALYGDRATGTPTHVGRVVRSGSGLALWHAHGGGSSNTVSNPGGPAGLSPLSYEADRLLGYFCVVPDVTEEVMRFLRTLQRDDFGPFLAFMRRARVLPEGV